MRILVGLLVLGGVGGVSALLDMRTLQASVRNLLPLLPVVIVVLFQNQIRSALARVGRYPLLQQGGSSQGGESRIDDIVTAARDLSSQRIGALIVVERMDGLRDFAENGIAVDAALSHDLLVTVFTPGTPLHDGAVIVQKSRIAAAACFLPLTSARLSNDQGTRHRAAVGITEQTDAIVVVVSEETGGISVAGEGRLTSRIPGGALRGELERLIGSGEG